VLCILYKHWRTHKNNPKATVENPPNGEKITESKIML